MNRRADGMWELSFGETSSVRSTNRMNVTRTHCVVLCQENLPGATEAKCCVSMKSHLYDSSKKCWQMESCVPNRCSVSSA